jgi:putative glutamine amidotransferase
MTKPTFIRPKILVLEGLFSDTVDIIDNAGGDAFEVMPWDIADVERELMYGNYHGLVLTGGSDIDPALYGEKPHKEVYGVDQLRDTAELYALDMAEMLSIPVLGICRGSQIMCAAQGGKLTQHIEGHRGGNHPVEATPEAKTFKRAINSRRMDVISLHHQCIRRPGKGMRIAARALDGTPEAIESKDGRLLGVQFHPEMAAYQNGNAWSIFTWLVQAAATHANGTARQVNFREVKGKSRSTWRGYSGYTVKSSTTAAPKNREAGTRPFADAQGVEGTDTDGKVLSAMKPAPGGESNNLWLCGECAMLFDFKQDRDDHEAYIHRGEPFPPMFDRYPELLPPPGHEAYDPDDSLLPVVVSTADMIDDGMVMPGSFSPLDDDEVRLASD